MNMNTMMFLQSLLFAMVAAQASSVRTEYPQMVKSNSVTVTLTPLGQVPEWMAVVVQTNDPMEAWRKNQQAAMAAWRIEVRTNHYARPPMTPPPPSDPSFENPQWLPFSTNLTVDLGSGDGRRNILFSFRYKGQARGDGWNGGGIVVQSAMPLIVITEPKQNVTSRPVIQLRGYFSRQARKILYDLYDQNGVKTVNNVNCLVLNQYFDEDLRQFTTNYFQCFDVSLSPGTNTFVIHGEDWAGNHVSTNFVIVFSTAGATNPPIIMPKYPLPGMVVAADSFIAMGTLDDPTAHLAGQISANGHGRDITFRVGRSGDYYSVEELPVSAGANQLSLTATDAAGNSASTNMVVYGGDARVTMDPFDPFHPVGPWITVTGKVSPANYSVWVDGVQALVKPDGTWRVEKLPDRRLPGGGWVFDLTAIRPGGLTNGTSKLHQVLSAQASLSTNTTILNPSTPACGIFQLHLAETAGRRFILEASTNLVAWQPILTNSDPGPSFDYTDTNANNNPCRFFRVIPLP
ncbi:MAG: hypothetical protein ACLQU3_14665 [Limisphaerales bacterium]